MRGVYESNFQWAALTTAQTLCTISVPATIAIEILSGSVTDTNNATNQQLEDYFQRTTNALAGTGTAALTPSKTEVGDQASACSVIFGSSASQTEPTYSANTKHGLAGYASLAGWQYAPVPEERVTVPPLGFIGLKHNLAGTSTAWDVYIRHREIG